MHFERKNRPGHKSWFLSKSDTLNSYTENDTNLQFFFTYEKMKIKKINLETTNK